MKRSRDISILLSMILLTSSYSTTKTADIFDVFAQMLRYFQDEQAQEQKQQQYQNEQQRSNNQHQANFNTAPRITLNDYLNQLQHDLRGLNQQTWRSIESKSYQNLQNINLQNTEAVNQIMRSILIEVTGEESDKVVENFQKNGWRIDHNTKCTIRNSMESNILARISQSPHLSGENLYQFYGEELKKTIESVLKDPSFYKQPSNNNYNSPQKPTPSAPPADHARAQYPSSYNNARQQPNTSVSNTPHRQECAKKNRTSMKNMLMGSDLTHDNIAHLESLIFDSTLSAPSADNGDFISHAKNSFAQFLDEQLSEQEKALKNKVKDLKKLRESIETTRSVIIAELTRLNNLDKTAIKKLFAANNLESTILENMGDISCSVCCEFYMQDHHEGTVNKKQLPCKHFTCGDCINLLNRKCPICRASF